jgi:hypothetical protein
MRWLPNIPDTEIDRLLAGHKPEDSGLDGVAQFLQDVDSAFAETPTAEFETAHVAAMLAAASSPEPSAMLQARRGHAFAFKNLAAHKWASATALSLMGLLAFGGAAYAGVLPTPVQDATSDLVQHVGIKVPKAHRVNQAENNGVRDHGAGVGNGKGQGGIRRDLNNAGGFIATGTVDADKASIPASSSPKPAVRAGAKGKATNAAAKAKARAKAAARTRKRVPAKKIKVKAKASSSVHDDRKSSAVETDRENGKGN